MGFLWQPCRVFQQRPQPKRRRRRRRHRQWQQMLFDIYALINTINNKPKPVEKGKKEMKIKCLRREKEKKLDGDFKI